MGPVRQITLLIMLFCSFCSRFKNRILWQLLVLDHKALDERGKIFCVTTNLETKSFKII